MHGKRVKLFCGLIVRPCNDIINRARLELEKAFSQIEIESQRVPFKYTDYYRKEMGGYLLRFWWGFRELVEPELLSEIKRKTMSIEDMLRDERGFRQVNIDPGYLDLSRIVLASTKDYSHRIYLRNGIFAEIEYTFVRGKFEPVPWTYPDYRDTPAMEFFAKLREIYKDQIRKNCGK